MCNTVSILLSSRQRLLTPLRVIYAEPGGQRIGRGTVYDDAEHDERQPDQQGHQGAGFLDERHQGLAVPAACGAEREPADSNSSALVRWGQAGVLQPRPMDDDFA